MQINRITGRGLRAAAAAALALSIGAASAGASDYGFQPEASRLELSTSQAGGHPDQVISWSQKRVNRAAPNDLPLEGTLQSGVELPPGLVGNPTVADTCSMNGVVATQVTATINEGCSRSAAVGYMTARIYYPGVGVALPVQDRRIYRLNVDRSEPAAFGTSIMGYPVRLVASLRSDGDYGLTVSAPRMPEGLYVGDLRMTFWGVPADHQGPGNLADGLAGQPPTEPRHSFNGPLADAPRRAFMSNPTRCTGAPLPFVFTATSWATKTRVAQDVFSSVIAGCDQVPFEPSIEVTTESKVAGAPTSYQVDIVTPQSDDPEQLATAHLKDAVVALPLGTAISPSVSIGLQTCTDEQFGLRVLGREGCPEASKIGSVTVDTPLLDAPLTGGIYQGSQGSRDPRSGEMYRIFLSAAGNGVRIKLRGNISVDATTGQLTTTFVDNPQMPFDRFTLKFKGGDRAPLVNPVTCGVKTATGTLTAWSGAVRDVSSSVTIDQGCPTGAFAPTLTGGTLNPAAGSFSTFVMGVGRSDADQDIDRLTINFPEGVVGMISNVPLCGDAAANAGTCGEESRIGSITVATGTGGLPLQLPGRLYMTESYGGAPFGVSIVVPAIAGPFNLGDVVVRGTIKVDPATARITIDTKLPQIFGGIPLHMRAIDVKVDRDRFMFNATNCQHRTVGATLTGTAGGTASPSHPYQARGCSTLPYRAKLRLTIGARGKTKQNSVTPLKAVLTQPAGQANSKSIDVLLPRAVNARLEALRGGCPLETYQQDQCGDNGLVGRAFVRTPVLREPLSGNVYLVRNPARRLPDLMIALRGQVAIDVTGRVRVAAKTFQLGTNFDTIPDVPLTHFEMTFHAGRRALLGIATNLCSKEARQGRARVELQSQALGKRREYQKMTTVGCGLQASAAAKKAAAAKKKAAAAKKGAAARK